MKPFIRKLITGLALFFIVYIGTIALLAMFVNSNYVPNIRPLTARYGHMLTRLRDADTTTHADIIILGSSHAYRGFDTRLFLQRGYRAFNLGSSAQTPMQSRLLLDEYVDRMKPEMVIIEVMPTIFANDGTEASVDLISNHRTDWNMVTLTAEVFNPIVFNTFVYTAFKRVRKPLANVKESPLRGDDRYIPGGFVETSYLKKPTLSKNPPEKIEFRNSQLRAFYSMINAIERRNIKVLLVYAPVTPGWYDKIVNAEEIQKFFKDIDQRHSLVTYYDYSRFVDSRVEEYFYDAHHLNQKGVELFNQHFLTDVLPLRNPTTGNR